VIRYIKEERVLNDVFELLNEADTYPQLLAKKIADQVYFKIVLDCCEIKKAEFDKIVEAKDSMKY
jgi:hypothetical protein